MYGKKREARYREKFREWPYLVKGAVIEMGKKVKLLYN